MDIRQLKYFRAIVEEGQISRAAKRLHIAQPPLSLQLKLLEQELGVQLIERNTRSMRLTKAGHALYQRAEQILDMVEAATKEMKEFDDSVQGVLALGSPPALGNLYLPQRIKQFHEEYPGVVFQWREGNTFRILELLDAHLIEIGVVRLPVPESVYDSISLLTEPWVAVTRKDDKERNYLKSISLAEFGSVPLLLMNRQEGIHCHDMVLDELRNAGIAPNVVCESDNVLALLSLVKAGMGISILPQSTMSLRLDDDFHVMDIAGCVLDSSVAIVWLKGRRLSTAARLFMDTFR
jgi:DNA-binding transcriptional LysR family regulator